MKYFRLVGSILVVLTLAHTLSRAQMKITFDNVKYEVGLKQGINVPYIHSSVAWTNQHDHTGFHFGAYASFRTGRFAVQPEILFSRQSHSYTFPVPSPLSGAPLDVNTLSYTPVDFSMNFDYITVPIIFKYYLAGGLNLQAGAQFSWLSNGSKSFVAYGILPIVTSTGEIRGIREPVQQKISDFVRSSDIGVVVGLGWDIAPGVNLSARYNFGLIDMNKQPSLDIESPFATREAKNHMLQISLGLALRRFGSNH